MEYVQERVTTLHDFGGVDVDAPADRAAVVVPMTEREYAGLAAERVLSELESLAPQQVVVPLRAGADRALEFHDWLREFDLPLTTLWCDGPRVEELLTDAGVNGRRGKGRDVWLALGQALESEYVVVHDADTKSYSRAYPERLLAPLANGHDFAKGYYARVEDDRLYGRLFRLFYAPLVRALRDAHDAAVLDYLGAFRYALAGEFAATAELLSAARLAPAWGLEVSTLGAAFRLAGADRSAQVDLGTYEHDHRAVGGPTGLTDMSEAVGAALFRAVEAGGVTPDYDRLRDRYRATATDLVEQYAADAAFNGFEFDRTGERDQIDRYVDSVAAPDRDDRLPAWREVDLAPEDVVAAAEADLAEVRSE
ncbi:MAG: glycosyl transferase family 2 [Halolamina sp.]